jgi:pimeloyl-ACP methyl ester carboxylesterase
MAFIHAGNDLLSHTLSRAVQSAQRAGGNAVVRLLKIYSGIALAFALALVAGIGYQQLGSMMDARRYPEPGRLIDAGGHRLKINCTGTGSPTVILESGLGDILDEWHGVQTQVSTFARVCSYDRAGYGGSDAGPLPRTSSQIARELHALLQNAGEHPPFILIGHSFGGYNVRVFNGQYPAEVAGLVLVDAVQEDQYELLPSAWKQLSANLLSHWQSQARWMPLQISLGIARLRYGKQLGPYGYLILRPNYLKARTSELEAMQTSAEQAHAAGAFGNEPVIVLTGVRQDEALKNALSPEDFARFQDIWVQTLQPRLANLSTHGIQIVLRDVGHDIPGQDPTAVVNAVREIYAQTGQTLTGASAPSSN